MPDCRSLNESVAAAASSDPDRPFMDEVGGRSVTYGEADDLGRRWASVLSGEGVGAGAKVAVMAPPSADWVLAWLGVNWLGAHCVGINTALVGETLAYLLGQSRCEIAVVSPDLLPQVLAVSEFVPALRTVIVLGGDEDAAAATRPGLWTINSAAAVAAAAPMEGLVAPGPRDVYAVIYTSGTTGRPKGALVTWTLLHRVGLDGTPGDLLGPDDVWYSPFPINHVSGAANVYQAALNRGKVVLRESWRTQDFWSDIRHFGCTATMLIGAMASFLAKQPARPDDADNPLRYVQMTPLPEDVAAFEQRFAFQLWTIFAMTECGTVIASDLSPRVPRTCGRVRPGYEVRLVDTDWSDVPDGVPGELWVRADDPAALMQGYLNQSQSTALAWCDDWLRTGDMLRRDPEGNYYFVDRNKDVIRRRGENISSTDIERGVNAHPAVLDSAAVAVPSEIAEDEIKVVVELQPGAVLEPGELLEFLRGRLPRFMVPTFVEFTSALPRTDTGKVQKERLRRPLTTTSKEQQTC